MTASEAEAVAGGIAGVGILSADGVSLSNQLGQLVNQSVPCPGGSRPTALTFTWTFANLAISHGPSAAGPPRAE